MGVHQFPLCTRQVCAEGIVTKASVVRPKWVKSVHYCPATGKETTREYRCMLCRSRCISVVDICIAHCCPLVLMNTTTPP